MGKELYKAQQFIDAIPGTGGIVSTIALRVGCDWDTANKYIKKYASVKQAYDNERERVNDKAESVIINDINQGNVQTAKWWVSKKRPEIYGDKQQIEHSGHIDVTSLSDEELLAIVSASGNG